MLKALDWLNAHGDGIQSLGTVLAYLLALKGGYDAWAGWFRKNRQLRTYIDHLGGPAWTIHVRYVPPKPMRLYALIWPAKRDMAGLMFPEDRAETWLKGVPGAPPPVRKTLFQPYHVALSPLDGDSPVVGCSIFVATRPSKPWRVRIEIRDHDSDRLLISSRISPSRKSWKTAGSSQMASATQD
jgi:hypothetical protein